MRHSPVAHCEGPLTFLHSVSLFFLHSASTSSSCSRGAHSFWAALMRFSSGGTPPLMSVLMVVSDFTSPAHQREPERKRTMGSYGLFQGLARPYRLCCCCCRQKKSGLDLASLVHLQPLHFDDHAIARIDSVRSLPVGANNQRASTVTIATAASAARSRRTLLAIPLIVFKLVTRL